MIGRGFVVRWDQRRGFRRVDAVVVVMVVMVTGTVAVGVRGSEQQGRVDVRTEVVTGRLARTVEMANGCRLGQQQARQQE